MVYRSAKIMSTINSLLYLHDKNEVYHKFMAKCLNKYKHW